MGNMSIDEIIKQAEKIKQEAEYQLQKAEKRLDEKAKLAIEEVSVQPDDVEKLVDDVKEFVPLHKKQSSFDINKTIAVGKLNTDSASDDIKVAKNGATAVIGDLQKTKNISSVSEESKTKPVILSTNTKVDKASDLQEMPTLVSVDSLDNGFHYNAGSDFEEDFGVQMTFDGFDDKIEDVPTIDEEVAEKILRERREEKVGKFRLFGPEETDKDLDEKKVIKTDYASESDKATVAKKMRNNEASIKRKIIITVVVGAVSLLLTLFKESAYFPSFLTSHTAYFAVALVLNIVAFVVNFNIIIHGFRFKNGINFDFTVAISSILVLLHTALLTFVEDLWLDNGVLLLSVGCFAMVMSQLGKLKMIKRVEDGFDFLTDGEDKYTLENITNTVDAQIISRGILDDDEPLIKTSVKTDFPTNFLNISCKNEPADKIATPLTLAMLGLSLVLFVVVGIIDNFNTGFNMFLCSFSIASPVVALFATNSLLWDVSKITSRFGARVCGFEGAVMADNANAMVMEASDFFDRTSCDEHGIKIFNNAKIDEVLLYSAAVMIKTKSPLAHVFDDVIIGKQSILPPVENVVYENKMGTSAWVYGKKVLVGNRNLLLAHGVSVPKEEFEQKYTQRGRCALYLAVDGKICAMFILSYSANPDLKRELKKLEKSGITLILRSCDPYINEQSLSELFGLPEGFIRVMNYSSARVFEKYSNMNVEKSPAYVIHNGTALSFVCAMRGAENIVSSRSLIKFLVSFGSAIGFGIIALLAIIGAYAQVTAVGILAFQIIWGAFVILISKLKRIGL